MHIKLARLSKLFVKLTLSSLVFVAMTSFFVHANYDLYLDQLRLMNIAVDDYIDSGNDNDTISRYELAQLLNTVECQDCINPATDMIETYTKAFWESFIQLPGKDFDEINYLWGIYNQKSYYYCVAYVGDHNYMRGYPESVSPVCAGMFCGAKSVTKAEFIQVIINLLVNYIYPQYSANWSKIEKRTSKIKNGTQANGYVDATDRALIKQKSLDCPQWICQLDNGLELKTYLKYCMFNLKACKMQSFGNIWQAYWPVAELNILYNQNIIDYNEAQKDDIDSPAKWSVVLKTLYKLYQFVDCEFNNDYDCDTMDNANDNCPNKYNPSQTDTDNDWIGDVCDDDIDGDGIVNPVGIIDELGRINISVATTGMDNCLLTQNHDQKITHHPFIGDACFAEQNKVALYISPENIKKSAPTEVSFDAITKGEFEYIKWNMWDGTELEGEHVSHYYRKPGPYTISAIAQWPHNKATAKVSIILWENTATYHGIQIIANRLGTDWADNILFGTESAGQIDKIIWNFGDNKPSVSRSPVWTFNKLFEHNWQYIVTSQIYLKGQYLWETRMTIGIGDNNKWLAIKANKVQIALNEEIKLQSNGYWFSSDDIKYIERDFGDADDSANSKQTNKATTMSYRYKTIWSKRIKQTTVLKDGEVLIAYITIFVNDPSHTTSHALQLIPNKLWLQKWEKINFTMQPIWDLLWASHVLEYSHIPFDIHRIFSPVDRPIQSNSVAYYQAWLYHPKSNLIINQCQSLENQATIVVHGLDMCLEALLGWTLDQFSCDMDGDWIPDICDNDIDGDGVENLIGVISYENKDCSINADNIDENKLWLHLKWVCTLDNCPFVVNSDQSDLNIDYIGDACKDSLWVILDDFDNKNWDNWDTVGDNSNNDRDGDGITDSTDQCPNLAENYNGINDLDGCPEIWNAKNCPAYRTLEWPWDCDDVLCPGPCFSCPCQFADYASDLAPGDKVWAKLFDLTRTYFYDDSLPVLVDDYIDFGR